MKNHAIYTLLLMFITLMTSCSKDDTNLTSENLKNVTDCGLTIEPDTLNSICVDGTNLALPDEIITFASSFFSKNDNPNETQFSWIIESGDMEVLNVENSIDNLIAKSVATIKFNSNYSGNGIIKVFAENELGHAVINHIVELELN